MRYHHQAPSIYLGLYGRRYICDHPVYNSCTLFEIGEKGLAVIQQRYDAEIKSTWWSEIDPWLTDELYLHPGFKEFFDLRANKPKDGLYPHRNHPADHVGIEAEALAKSQMGDGF